MVWSELSKSGRQKIRKEMLKQATKLGLSKSAARTVVDMAIAKERRAA